MSQETQNDPADPEGQAAPPRNRWQRFIDWLAGGPPDPIKIQAAQRKPWYNRYSLSVIIMGGGWAVMLPYPYAVDLLNEQPDRHHIQTVQAKVLKTGDRNPHFLLELPSGERVSAYWPTRVHQLGYPSFYGWTRDERTALVGCQATVLLSPVKYWMLFQQQRVWALRCAETGFEVTLPQAQDLLASSIRIRSESLWIFSLIVFAPLGFVFFLREKRGVL